MVNIQILIMSILRSSSIFHGFHGYSNGLTWPMDHWNPLVTGLNKAWMVWDMAGIRKTKTNLEAKLFWVSV